MRGDHDGAGLRRGRVITRAEDCAGRRDRPNKILGEGHRGGDTNRKGHRTNTVNNCHRSENR